MFYNLACRFLKLRCKGVKYFFLGTWWSNPAGIGTKDQKCSLYQQILKYLSVHQAIQPMAYWLFINDFYLLMEAVRKHLVEKVGRYHWEWSGHPILCRSTWWWKEADITVNEMPSWATRKLLLVKVAKNQQEQSNHHALWEELQRSCEVGLKCWF